MAGVMDLGNGYGYAMYGEGVWRLYQGFFNTLADLNSFSEPIYPATMAGVDPSGEFTSGSIIYVYDGSNWDRTPDGTPYTYPDVADWAALSALDTHSPGDLARVLNLGFANSTGTARFSGTQWELSTGYFATTVDRDAFPNPVVEGATIYVGPAASYFDDLSNRQTGGIPFTWTITSLSQTDPSGIGVTRVGDYGVYTNPTSGAVNTYRLATIPIAVGAGGGSVTRWIPPDFYGRANLQVVSYIVGGETMPGYGSSLRGYLYENLNGGTISSVSGYMRLDAPAPGSGGRYAFMTGPAISGSKRFYVVSEIRGFATGSSSVVGFYNSASIAESQWTVVQQQDLGGGFRPVLWNGSGWVAVATSIRNGTGNTIPTSTPWLVEGISSGGAITDMMETRVDGLSYCSVVRNMDGATTGTDFNILIFSGGISTGSSSGRIEVRNHYVITCD
jgi:hypothetical protein